MEALNTQTSVPLYSQLAEQLRQDIYTGRFTQGEKIPSEFELSSLYNVSRSTVRKAISVLVSENLLETTHGKGTFVSSPKINQNSSGFLSFTENVRSMGKTLITRTIHMTHVVPSEHQKHFFRLDEKEKLLEVERLRYIDHIPICVETSWFTSRYDSLQEKNLNGSLYEILRNDYDIRPLTGSKTIELCYASPDEAALLDIPRGSALMLIEDLVYDNHENPLHISKQVLRGDKFRYASK